MTGAVARFVAACWAGMLFASPAGALEGTQLAVIVNMADPLSVRIGDYYAARRRILFQNVIRVEFPPGRPALTRVEFAAIKASVDRQALPGVQAYAVTWAAPYRVECMSLTSALAFGFDPAFCAEECVATRVSAYFDSNTRLPYAQLRMRPAMAIAAADFEQAKALIDRGIASDGTFPVASAYLLTTSDKARDVRSAVYPRVASFLRAGPVAARHLRQDFLYGARDVMFYFTGEPIVQGLQTLQFVPGAIADHVTSAGGMLTDSYQMSALRWLEAGATGSYGAVVEPCAMAAKFPDPLVAIRRYLQGEFLIEAYWKSVAMPGQGIFIGDPLAAPYRRTTAR